MFFRFSYRSKALQLLSRLIPESLTYCEYSLESFYSRCEALSFFRSISIGFGGCPIALYSKLLINKTDSQLCGIYVKFSVSPQNRFHSQIVEIVGQKNRRKLIIK